MDEQDLLRIEDVARRLCLSRSKVYDLTRSGALPSVRVDTSVRVHRADLDAWVASLRSDTGGSTRRAGTSGSE